MNKHEQALEMLRMYWGKMIDLGATTVWEEFELDWNLQPHQQPPQPYGWGCNSLCQPAGSGPAEWLMREILGVTAIKPGFKKVQIKPFFSDLDYAKGTIPTPLGNIDVSWKKAESKTFEIHLNIPTDVEETQLVLSNMSQIKINGKLQPIIETPDKLKHVNIKDSGKILIELK